MTNPWIIVLYFAVAVLDGIDAYIRIKKDDSVGAALWGGLSGMWFALGLVKLFS